MLLLPWERLLWSGGPAWPAGRRYTLTDFRVVVESGPRGGEAAGSGELLLDDIEDVDVARSRLDRLLRTTTLTIRARDSRRRPLMLRGIRRGPQVAAVLALLLDRQRAELDPEAIRATLAWDPAPLSRLVRPILVGAFAFAAVVFGVVIGLQGDGPPVVFPADDAIYPAGVKRERDGIVHFMEDEVMPWAKVTLAPIVGGPERVTCATCHGAAPEAREWEMPAVAALPEPLVRERGWEVFSAGMDPQMRNAIYGYAAELDNQTKAAYMRQVVLPGMARLLHRPAYDFTRSYTYNRSQSAFGCYHCHQVRN